MVTTSRRVASVLRPGGRRVDRYPRWVTREALAQWIGWAAAIAFFARIVPQPVKLFRTGVPDGVSPLAALNNVVTDLGWALYGIVSVTTQVWLTAVVALVPGVWTVLLLRRECTRVQVLLASTWLVIVMAMFPLDHLDVVLGVSVVVNHGPQVWTVLRESDLRGISVATWCLAIADATLWGGFGVLEDDLALVGYGAVLMTAAVIVLARVWWTSRSASSGPTPDHLDGGLAYTPAP